MPSVTIRNLPDEVHRAIRVRAAQHGCSIESEMRNLLEAAVKPRERIKLGSKLADIGRRVKLTDQELAVFDSVRDKSPARAASLG
jgi:plasmid stability protein